MHRLGCRATQDRHGVWRLPRERKTGARGLRTILENILLDTMYDLPSIEGVLKVVIDESVVEGSNQPYLVYEGGEQQKLSQENK